MFLLKNLHSNMFLLFDKPFQRLERYGFIYIPICFYYFLLFKEANASPTPFTFQYVSIISEETATLEKFKEIYIPICFYYFSMRHPITSLTYVFTFQYVSIIFFGLVIPLRF